MAAVSLKLIFWSRQPRMGEDFQCELFIDLEMLQNTSESHGYVRDRMEVRLNIEFSQPWDMTQSQIV